MSPIKDRSVSTENARCALVTEYQRYEESVLREKSYALNMADRELIRLAVFDPHGVNDARELIATIMAAIDPASRQKITQSPETKQTLLLKALFNRGFFLAPRWVHMI